MASLSNTSSPLPARHTILRCLAKLPLPVFRAAGALFGLVLLAFAAKRRGVVRRNLELCFPEASPAQRGLWMREVFVHFGQTFVDRVWLWQGDPALVERRVELAGRIDLLEAGSPVICFVPHFYGMDAGWSRLTRSIARSWWTFYSPQNSPAMDAWIREGRQRHGQPRLVSRYEGVRPLIKGLREGAALCLLPDMDLGERDSVFVSFFGNQAATVTSLSRLAKATGAPVLSWTCRVVPGGYRVEVSDVWSGYPSGDDQADARGMNERLEHDIRAMPGQYHWLHRRFKTRPPGQPDPYDDR